MKSMRRKSKFSKILSFAAIACIVSLFLFNKSNKNTTMGISVPEYHAAVTDSRFISTEAGYNCQWESQHNGYVCYAYSLCTAMEASVYMKYGVNVNFKETHMVNAMNSGTLGSTTTAVWNNYLSPRTGPVEEDAYESKRYYATRIIQVSDINSMKNALVNYGGLDAGINWTESNGYRATNSDGSACQCTPRGSGIGIGHGVTILGWDDNYPKENFPAACGVTENGAFYTYNPANGGALWVSYQDNNICNETFAIEMARVDEDVPPPTPTYQFSTDGLTIDDIPYGDDISKTYTGGEITGFVTAFFNTEGVQLHEGTDFNVSYSPHVAVGTFQMYLNGMGNYEGQQIIKNINITPKDIAQISVEIESVNSDGTIAVNAEYNGNRLALDSDYTVEYRDSTNAGKKIAKISGKGNYNGWVEREFTPNGNQGTEPHDPHPANLVIDVKNFETIEDGSINYIAAIPEKTTISALETGIETNGTIEVFEGETKVTSGFIKTGMKIRITKGEESAEGFLVVNGDVNGDGVIDGIDVMKVSRYVSNADKSLSGAYLVAANVHEQKKNNTINNNDTLRIARYLISLENNLK